MRRNAVQVAAGVLAAIGLCATSAQAQGYSVYEHDACAMGRAGAGVASPCAGGSAVFFNPAGIVTGQAGTWNLAFGATLIPPRGSWTPDGGTTTDLVENNIPVPNVYLTRQFGSRLAVGVGMFLPYGLTTEWPTTSPGRFLSYKATIKSIYIQPTVAVRVNPRIQVGAGLDIVISSVDLNKRVDASSLPLGTSGATFAAIGIPGGTDFADAVLHGTGTAYGAHFGIIVRPIDALSLGVRYMTGVTIEGAGDATFSQIPTGINLSAGQAGAIGVPTGTPLDAVLAPQFATGAFVAQSVDATIPMPSQLVAGFDLRVMTGLHLMGDVQWTNWSAFERLPLTLGVLGAQTLYEDYVNTVGYRAAVEYAVTPKLNLRGGFLMHGAAAPDHTVTPLLPEAARKEFVLGAGYQLSSGIRVDAAYQIIKQDDRDGRVADWTPTHPVPNTGVYKFSANLIGVGLSFAF